MPMQRTRNSGMTFSHGELAALAGDVQRLSNLLTRDRGHLPAGYLEDPALRRAYVLYFLPANLSKIHTPLRELFLHPKIFVSKERLRVLDLGAGPGTAVLGVLDFFARQERRPTLEFTAVDHVAENLREAENLFRKHRAEHGVNASLRTVKTDIERSGAHLTGEFDIIILSNALNELFHGDGERIPKRIELLKSVLGRHLAPDGSAVIIEPALHKTSREMLMVRDGLLGEGSHVYSPCLRQGKCPALVNPRDWCHEDVPWNPPEIVKEIDSRIGLRKDSLKFSYLVLRKKALSLADMYGGAAFRVVSEKLVSKGKIEFYICGEEGRRLVTRLDKDITSVNETFGHLRRGDIVRFEGLVDEGKRFKVGKETKVERT
jgi:ribosomal protein RSM22 (predicted rRNA methylase)